eukprot:3167042-Amphidinium_carterae.1
MLAKQERGLSRPRQELADQPPEKWPSWQHVTAGLSSVTSPKSDSKRGRCLFSHYGAVKVVSVFPWAGLLR